MNEMIRFLRVKWLSGVLVMLMAAAVIPCAMSGTTYDISITVTLPTLTPTPTVTPTVTPTPTNTPTQTPTNTPTATSTNTPTKTPTYTPTNTPTITPTSTPTDTPTTTPTATPTVTPTNTPDIIPPDAPGIAGFFYNNAGQISEIQGTAEGYSTVHIYDGEVEIGTAQAGESGSWTFVCSPPLASAPHSISAVTVDSSNNPSEPSYSYSVLGLLGVNSHRDTVVTHSSGVSLRLEKEGLHEFKITVNENSSVLAKAWLRYNSEYGTAAKPKITLTGLGITGTGGATASMNAVPDTWQQLTVTGTPAGRGVATLKVETFSTAENAETWIDDVTVSQ